jgi:hypothetical protein
MASTYSSLKIELIGTGDQSGLWGATTNTNLGTAIEQAIVGMATLVTGDFTSNVATLTLTDTNAAQNARAFVLNITATLSAAGTVNVPAIQKPYIILNNSVGGYAVTVKVTGQTGVSVPNGAKILVYNNGTDVGAAITHLTSLTLASALPVASGGTGITSFGTGVATALGQNVTGSGGIALATSPTFTAYRESVQTATVSAATYNINLSLGNIFDITLGNNVTFTFTNPPSAGTSASVTIILRQDATGNRTATFTGALYTDGNPPQLSTGANDIDVLTFFTINGGASYFGTFAMANVS